MKPRRKPSLVPGSTRRVRTGVPATTLNTESEGYDAEQGSPEEGLDPLSLASEEDGEGTEAGLSLDTEDLGPRMLESAMQGSRGAINDSARGSRAPSEPGGLDLTQNVIDEGSLFDQPRAEGGTRHPEIRTSEVDATLERNERATRERHRRGPRQR